MSGAVAAAPGDPVEQLLGRLSQDGFSITAEDFARVRRVHALQAGWKRGELRNVLRACVLRSPEFEEVFARAFTDAYGPGEDQEQVFPKKITASSEAEERALADTSTLDPATAVKPARSEIPPPPGPRQPPRRKLQLSLVFIAGGASLAALAFFAAVRSGSYDSSARQFDPEAFILGLLAAALLTSMAATIAHLWLRLTVEQAQVRQSRFKSLPMPAAVAGGRPFRVGLVGSELPLPDALGRRRGRRIAELLTYVDAGPDAYRYDIPASARRRATYPQETSLVHARRRVLPEVVFLCDTACPGPRWNPLAANIERLFRERGLAVEVIEVDGSFHRGEAGGMPLPTQTVRSLLADLEDAPPRVVLVFTDGARMHAEDLAVLRRLRKAGPVLWLDYCDRHLWDVRHAAIASAGIVVRPATEQDLEAGLRAVYAPGLRAANWQPWREPEGRSMQPRRQVWHTLGEASDWAADCALLQPISLGLANRIREELHSDLPWHAFSRLLALPGSSLAAEGLRFGMATAAILRQRFALRRSSAMQKKLTSLLQAALERDRPAAGTYAEAAWDWTRLQVEVFTDPDTALPAIAQLRDSQLLDPAALDRLLDRIRQGTATERSSPKPLSDEVLLSVVPISMAARAVLEQDPQAGPPVSWQVGGILLRDDLPPAGGHAAFTAAGEVFARLVRRSGQPDAVAITGIALGRTEEQAAPDSQALVALAGAGRAKRLVALSGSGALLVLDPTAEGYGQRLRASKAFGTEEPTSPLLAISADGKWAAAVMSGQLLVSSVDDDSGAEASRPVKGITALSAAGPLGFLAGFDDGRLLLCAFPNADQDAERTGESNDKPVDVALPGKVTALSVFESATGPALAVVAAGRALHMVELDTGAITRTIHLGWDATVAEAFADGVTVAVSASGRFDIIDASLGLSALDLAPDAGGAQQEVCAISDEGRRFAAVETPERLEVRALKKLGQPTAKPAGPASSSQRAAA